MGNRDYALVPSLDNPVNDATDIGRALSDLGFDADVALDVDLAAMRRSLSDFAAKAAEADVALFYYAGHGFQIGGENFLAPVDFDLGGEVSEEAIALGEVLGVLDRSKGLKFVFLDACRDQPEALVAGTGVELGFAKVQSAADFLISFATQPGAVSWDGAGRNGIYTGALLSHLFERGQTVGEMLIDVRRDVIARTGGQQVPWDNSSLTRQFSFAEGQPQLAPEARIYQLAVKSGSDRLLNLYLDMFPSGPHAKDVREIISGTELPVAKSGSGDDIADDLLAMVQETRSRSLSLYFLDAFPEHDGAETVRRLAEALPDPTEVSDDVLCERLATHPRDATPEFPGVESSVLAQNVDAALAACRTAVARFPEQPRFKALLARVHAAQGDGTEAVRLFREAAAEGNLRATISLAHFLYAGRWMEQDRDAAERLYRIAAEAGSDEGANNFAYMLQTRDPTPERKRDSVTYFRRAYDNGSAEAAFNLGYLALLGEAGDPGESLGYYLESARRGYPKGYREAAVLLQHGVGAEADPDRAARLLLRAIAADDGSTLGEFVAGGSLWQRPVIAAIQTRLVEAGLLEGTADGLAGPATVRALTLWRNGGFHPALAKG